MRGQLFNCVVAVRLAGETLKGQLLTVLWLLDWQGDVEGSVINCVVAVRLAGRR